MNDVRDVRLTGTMAAKAASMPGRANLIRSVLVAGLASGAGACANEPLKGPSALAPMMMLNAPAAAAHAQPVADTQTGANTGQDLSRKSLAAKVLASRALETVTGLKADPARLSEHD